MEVHKVFENIVDFAVETAEENNVSPMELAVAMLFAGVSFFFAFAKDDADKLKLSNGVVNLVNDMCASLVEGLGDEKA